MEITIDENKGKAVCKDCGKLMPNVQKGHADYCYDCEDKNDL